MSYIGNQPYTAAFLVDTKSGDGTTTAFTLTIAPANTSSCIVAITGVLQDPSTYSVSGTTLTFSAAPPTGTSNISVRYLGIPASGVTTTAYSTVTDTTATAGQTSFTIPSYTVGYLEVFRNGVYLPNADYTATTGTTVVLTNAATAGDTITTISFYVSSVLNAIPATANSVTRTYMPIGSVLQVVSTILTTGFSASVNNSFSAVTGLTASITPTTSSSKIMVLVAMTVGSDTNYLNAQLTRGGSAISGAIATTAGSRSLGTSAAWPAQTYGTYAMAFNYLDSPATTSSTTYGVQIGNSAAATLCVNQSQADDNTAGRTRGTSTITVMEIAA